MAPFVDGPARPRRRRAPRSTCPGARPRTRCRRSTWRCPSAPDVAVGGHSFGGRVASLAAAEPDAPYAAPRLLQLPAPPARRARADRRADRPLAGHPLPRPAAARASRIRSPGSTCCGPPSPRLAQRRAGDLPAPRPHAQAGPRRRPGPGRGLPAAVPEPDPGDRRDRPVDNSLVRVGRDAVS